MRIIIVLILSTLFFQAKGQDFKLLGIQESPNDSLLSNNTCVDLNNNISAIVILSFMEQIQGLAFKGNIIQCNSTCDSVYVLYVPTGTKKLTVQHDDYYPFILDFKENNIVIEGGHAYHVFMGNTTTKADKKESNLQYLTFKSETPIKNLIVNNDVWLFKKGSASKLVPVGVYHYLAESTDGRIVKGQAEVKNKQLTSKVVKIEF